MILEAPSPILSSAGRCLHKTRKVVQYWFLSKPASADLVNLHICGNTTHILAKTVESGADLFNVDHMASLIRARDVYGAHGKCFKGNMDPVAHVMQAGPSQCEAMAHKCIGVARGTNYMLSAGCEIPAETPDDVFRAFCDAPRTYRSSASSARTRSRGSGSQA